MRMRLRRNRAGQQQLVRDRLPRWLSFGVAPFAFSLAVAFAVAAYAQGRALTTGPRAASGSAGHLTTAQLMNLAPLQPRLAPGFALTDQRGTRVTLASFRGKAVLLGFYDPRCTQVCPIVAQMLRMADRDLGAYAGHVVFIGVNVNPAAESVADVQHFSVVHGLAALPNWYFLTGSTARLEAVWQAYGIEVASSARARQTVHSDYLYFLDPFGTERYLAEPVTGQKGGLGYLPGATIGRWGHGIAQYLKLTGKD